jgi:phosphoenolpyruvate-protein phosphotransferase/dihydroxyacetone kinase phosphotransfer subunit
VTDPAEPRVGLVVVSHSAGLAEGIVELAAQMAPGVPLVAAGGMADGSIGTDAVRIAEAIAAADHGAGVVIMADLGSAVLSTKMALDLVDPEIAGRAELSNGPAVEGTVVAAVRAASGSSLEEVLRESEAARSMQKDAQEVAGPGPEASRFEAQLRNPSGLHARPAAEFQQTAARFHSRVWLENVTRGDPPVDAKSPVAILSTGSRKGHVIRVSAEGEDQDDALAALLSLVADQFGETEPNAAGPREVPRAVRPAAPAGGAVAPGAVVGISGAPGVAVGPIWSPRSSSSTGHGTLGQTDMAGRIRAAAGEASDQLRAMAARVRARGRGEQAEVLAAQAVFATDRALIDAAVAAAESGLEASSAVTSVFEEAAARQQQVGDELLAARAADIRDVGARIARIIRGEALELPSVPSIAVAEDLPPSVAEEIPEELLLGVAIQGGSATSHVVILSRGRGIPAVVAVPGLMDAARTARTIAVDGGTGEVMLDPGESVRAEFEQRARGLAERRATAAALRDRPATTADDRRVALLANIGGPEDSARAIEMGADGVGLFRTEFLFMKRRTAPTEEEQVEPYRRVFEAFGPDRPVVVRLADIGGDKAVPYLGLPPEDNPFLGVRAIRLADRSPDLLAAQLRAIWRAAGLAGVVPHVMAPMVSTLADARLLVSLRDEARAAVAAAGAPLPERMVTGVMVEVPSAALIADELARLVDFFSIGTNDLTQYTLAADRSNPALASLQDALHPAVLRLVERVVAGGHEAGIEVAVCGELAGDPLGALVLVGLGVDELSADAGSLDAVRAILARVTSAQLADLARRALAAPDAASVRAMAREVLA